MVMIIRQSMELYVFITIFNVMLLGVAQATSTGWILPKLKYVYYQLQIPENSPVGKLLDLDLTVSVPGEALLYDITSGNEDNQFTIDRNTGAMKTTNQFDREKKARYVLKVRVGVSGDPKRSATATVVVVVTDVNDNPPICFSPRNATVRGVAPPGQVVLSLRCSDKDEGRNAEFIYKVSHPGSYFPFNVSQYGNILVSSQLAYRDDERRTAGLNTFKFEVNVRNKALPLEETMVKVTIDIVKAACPNGWKYRRLTNHYLVAKFAKNSATSSGSSESSESSCTDLCERQTSYSCNSVNWNNGKCEMMTETDFTTPGSVHKRRGSVILIKYCIAEPEPSPYLKDFLKMIPSGGVLIPPLTTYSLLEILRFYTHGPDDQTHTDVWVVTEALQILADRTDIATASVNFTSYILQSMSSTVSNLLQDMYLGHWTRLHKKGNESSTLLMSMETLTKSIATRLTDDVNVTTDRVEVLAVKLDPVLDQDKLLELSPGGGPPTSVNLSPEVIPFGSGSVNVVVSVFEDMDRITNISHTGQFSNASHSNGNSERVLIGDVVSVVVHPPIAKNFTKPIVMEIESLPKEGIDVLSRQCVFLYKTDVQDEWRPDGCDTTSSNSTHTRCECYHLTNFAVLMQIVHVEMTKSVELSLEVLTIIGCIVSILSLMATIIANLWLKMNSERVLLLINLSVSLILAQVVFMAGGGATQNSSSCRVIAALLHYLYLTVFSLMLVEGLQLYMRLYLAFHKDGKVVIFIVAGWSLPFLLVGISVGVDPEGYGTSYSCWLSTERGTIWAFVGPALIIGGVSSGTAFVNLFVLGMVIKTFLSLKINARKTDRQKFLSSLKAASVLLPLLGITWTFGVLAINSSTVAFQYLFALLNSTQGLFIFLFHVVYNDEVRVAYWKKRGRILTVNSVTHSNSTALTSTNQAKKKAFAGFMASTHM